MAHKPKFKELTKKLGTKHFETLAQIRKCLEQGDRRKHVIRLIDQTLSRGYDICNTYYTGENDLYKD